MVAARGIVSNIFAEGETIRGQGKKEERNEIKHKKQKKKQKKKQERSGSGKQASSSPGTIWLIYTLQGDMGGCVAISSEYIVCVRVCVRVCVCASLYHSFPWVVEDGANVINFGKLFEERNQIY